MDMFYCAYKTPFLFQANSFSCSLLNIILAGTVLQVWESQLELPRLPESFNKLCRCHDISDTIWRRAISMTELVTKDFDISLKSLLMSS